jgi:predicted GNAT superfamily acetyltransferase
LTLRVSTPAWELARRAASAAGVELRPIRTIEDANRVAGVAVATWGEEQPVAREMVRALAESGNVPFGAYVGAELIGFVLGWAGVDETEGLHVHSHMLAALPDRRHRGVGYALKLAQRAQALDQGIERVRWTFDPLVARNAYFNLHKLGAVVDRFERAFYGEMTDALNRGDRSDRFVVRWDLRDEPGSRLRAVPGHSTLLRRGNDEAPLRIADGPGDTAILEIPPEHAELRSTRPEVARAWRDAVADASEACLARDLLGVEFLRDRSAYVFERAPGAAGDAS